MTHYPQLRGTVQCSSRPRWNPPSSSPDLVGGFNQPLWKSESQLGLRTSQYMENVKSHVPNHQPVMRFVCNRINIGFLNYILYMGFFRNAGSMSSNLGWKPSPSGYLIGWYGANTQHVMIRLPRSSQTRSRMEQVSKRQFEIRDDC